MTGNYEKISPTAALVAYVRAQYTDMPYTKEIYRTVQQLTKQSLFERTPSFLTRFAICFPRTMETVARLEARYLAVNSVLENLGEDYAVVEIASGLSPRGLEWLGKNWLYVETDLAGMLSIKERVLDEILQEKVIRKNPNHHLYPLNALNYKDWDGLGRKFFSARNLNVAIINEGLLTYLAREELLKLRDNIQRFFETYSVNGIWITPDFSWAKRESRIARIGKKVIERDTTRRFNEFKNQGEVLEFLKEASFQTSFLNTDSVLDRVTISTPFLS